MLRYKLLLILVLALEIVLVPLYIKAMWPERNRKSLTLKMICSTMFICAGVLSVVIAGGLSGYAKLMLTGLLFGWVGDFFLHVSNKPLCLLTGLLSFLIGHVYYISAYFKTVVEYYPGSGFFNYAEAVVFSVLTAAFIAFALVNKKRFGKAFLPVIVYAAVLVLMFVKAGALGLRLASASYPNGTVVCAMLITGVTLFLVSDFILTVKVFLNKNETRRNAAVNIVTYFAAQNLLACTMLFI